MRARILHHHDRLGPAERRVARTLLDRYPLAGLDTVAKLAGAADVSPPTVIRLANRLGFKGFPVLQAALKAELQEQMESPLTLYDSYAGSSQEEPAEHSTEPMLADLAGKVSALQGEAPASRLDAAVHALADRRQRIHCIGGRSSRSVASSLAFHLNLLRPWVSIVDGGAPPLPDQLLDLGRRDTIFVVDFRRYQPDVISFAEAASARGARIVLLTDPWLSPIADCADHILVVDIAVRSPLDTLVTAQALIERILLGCIEALGDGARLRMKQLEVVRRDFTAAVHRREETGLGGDR
ncbi:MAG: MurR/RpiR family transcriptional regulator [Alphaproteobacteria bacterium]